MILYGENILSGISQSFIRSIVDIFKCRYCHGRVQRIGIYDIAVVLGGNINASRLQITAPDDCRRGDRISFCTYPHRLPAPSADVQDRSQKSAHLTVVELFDFFYYRGHTPSGLQVRWKA